jgi:hypothetical protein
VPQTYDEGATFPVISPANDESLGLVKDNIYAWKHKSHKSQYSPQDYYPSSEKCYLGRKGTYRLLSRLGMNDLTLLIPEGKGFWVNIVLSVGSSIPAALLPLTATRFSLPTVGF